MAGAQQFRAVRPKMMDRCYRVTITVFSVTVLLALTTYFHYEYDQDHIIVPRTHPTTISLDIINIFQNRKPSSAKNLILDSNTKFFGDIIFENTNKTIVCRPQISFSNEIPAIMSLNLNCFEKMKDKDAVWLGVAIACSKAMALLLFIYTVMWWNYFLLAEGSLLWGADRQRVLYKKPILKIEKPGFEIPFSNLVTPFPEFKIPINDFKELKVNMKQ